MTPKQKIASTANWNKKLVMGAIANLKHLQYETKDDYSYKLLQESIDSLTKFSVVIEIERDKAIAALNNPLENLI